METTKQPSGLTHPLLNRSHLRIKKTVAAKEIALDGLEDGDLLLIQTSNSVYSFSVTDASARYGVLMGGHLGEACASALLMGSRGQESGDAGIDATQLMAGFPAVFILALKGESTRLETSALKSLTRIKAVFLA